MFGWLCLALGIAFGSSLLPVFSIEVFVLGLATGGTGVSWLAVGATVAAGQVAGKLFYFLAARGSIRLPMLLHERLHCPRSPSRLSRRLSRRLSQRWRNRIKRLRTSLTTVRERCQQHPHWMATTYGASAVFGLPPYMATTVVAGLAQMRTPLFLAVGLAGRFVRFSALAAAPAFFASLLRL